MRSDIAARLNGVEKTLTGVLVALVDIVVLSKARAILRLPSQIVEVLNIKNFHDLFSASSLESSNDLANRSINGKLPLKEAAATVCQIISL